MLREKVRSRHCEEQRDEAIQILPVAAFWIASLALAMTVVSLFLPGLRRRAHPGMTRKRDAEMKRKIAYAAAASTTCASNCSRFFWVR